MSERFWIREILREFPKFLVIVGILLILIAGAGAVPKTQMAIPDAAGRIAIGSLGVILLIVAFWWLKQKSGASPSTGTQPLQVFPNTQDPKLIGHFNALTSGASEVILIGTGLAILEQNVITDLINRVNNGSLGKLELYLGNPYSRQVELRLWEEECGNHAPLIPKEVLKKKIRSILNEIDRNAQYKEKISFRLFSNYPTFAMFKIDSKYLIYNYSYAELGTYSPVLEFDGKSQALVKFFNDHYTRLKESSVNADVVDRIINNNFTKRDLDNLAAFAVYFVPDANCSEYMLGSEMLGYDVRTKSKLNLNNRWEAWIGAASEFGLHLTIADALYFFSQSDVNFLETRIKDFCSRLEPIWLDYEVVAGFPDATTISLVCTDPTGTLQALHSEMVTNCYTQAAGSNYTLRSAQANRNYCGQLDRIELMNNLYKAPYILDCFKPHITLLTKVPIEKIDEVASEIDALLRSKNTRRTMRVSKIAIMEKVNESWAIKGQEIPLGRHLTGGEI